ISPPQSFADAYAWTGGHECACSSDPAGAVEGPHFEACSGSGRALGQLQSVPSSEESWPNRMSRSDLGNATHDCSREVTNKAGAAGYGQWNFATAVVKHHGKGHIGKIHIVGIHENNHH